MPLSVTPNSRQGAPETIPIARMIDSRKATARVIIIKRSRGRPARGRFHRRILRPRGLRRLAQRRHGRLREQPLFARPAVFAAFPNNEDPRLSQVQRLT